MKIVASLEPERPVARRWSQATAWAAILCMCVAIQAHAADDKEATPYLDYFRSKGLTFNECAERNPRELFGWITERENLAYETGTTGDQGSTIAAFYARYAATLKPHLDSTAPAIAAARQTLRDVLYLIVDFYDDLADARDYGPHERADAYGEFILLNLARDGANADADVTEVINASREDAVHFILTRGMLNNQSSKIIRFAAFRATLRLKLKALERHLPNADLRNLRYLLMDFADHGQSL